MSTRVSTGTEGPHPEEIYSLAGIFLQTRSFKFFPLTLPTEPFRFKEMSEVFFGSLLFSFGKVETMFSVIEYLAGARRI